MKIILSQNVGLQQYCFLWPNESGDGFVTNNLFDLAGLLKVICRLIFIFSTCVEIDLTQWVKSVSAGAEVGLLRE